jgi:hypothetical protein
VAPGLDQGAGIPELHLDASNRCLLELRQQRRFVACGRGEQREEARGRIIRGNEQRGQLVPVGPFRVATQFIAEQRARSERRPSRLMCDDFPQHAIELIGHLLGGLEAVIGVERGRTLQEAVQRVVRGVDGDLFLRRQHELVLLLVTAEVRAQHRQRPADGEQVRWHRRARTADLGRLVSLRAVHGARLVTHAVDAAEIDERQGGTPLHHVVGLEVTEQQSPPVQVSERREDVVHVRDRVCNR